MTEEEKIFLQVREWIKENPSRIGLITSGLVVGMQEHANESRRAQVEWETIAAIAVEARLFKGQERILADKIEGMKANNAYRWDDIVSKLRKKHATKASKGETK